MNRIPSLSDGKTLNNTTLSSQEALPVRIKGLTFINSTSIMDQILNLIKPFMKKELTDLVSCSFTAFRSVRNH